MTCYDKLTDYFYLLVDRPGDKVLRVHVPSLLSGRYIATEPARPHDYELPFFSTLIDFFPFKEVLDTVDDIERDLINVLACIHKYFMLLAVSNRLHDYSEEQTVGTEIEFLFNNYRGFYDLIQKVICHVHRRLRPRERALPQKFSDIIDRIETPFVRNLPPPLLGFYESRRETFRVLRNVRTQYSHYGRSPGFIFLFPDGFAISTKWPLAKDLIGWNLWPERLLKRDDLGSVLSIFAYIARDMFNVMDSMGTALLGYFPEIPRSWIADGHRVFLRSSLAQHLTSLDDYRKTHWFDPHTVLGATTGDWSGGLWSTKDLMSTKMVATSG